jgi:hypothetical protein
LVFGVTADLARSKDRVAIRRKAAMRKIGKKQGKEQSRQLGFPVRGLARESSFDAVILSGFGLGTEMSESAVKGGKYVRGGGYTTVGVAAGEESGTS